MSNCISREGEYSDHKPDKDFCCTRCFALDETGLLARVRELEDERDAALAAIERCRGVIASWKSVQASNREQFESGNPGMIVPIDCVGGLSAALDGAPERGGKS